MTDEAFRLLVDAVANELAIYEAISGERYTYYFALQDSTGTLRDATNATREGLREFLSSLLTRQVEKEGTV